MTLASSAKVIRRSIAIALLGAWPVSHGSAATDIDAIYRFLEDGNLHAAQAETENQLATTPDDPSLLFAQAVIVEKMGHKEKAIEMYQELIDSYPELVEPYNNVAIYYAESGDYQSAIDTLEQALRANPSISTAYGNLTAIYSQLASAAYRKALNSQSPLKPLQLASLDKIESQQTIAIGPTQVLVASVNNFADGTIQQNAIADNSDPSGDQPVAVVETDTASQPVEVALVEDSQVAENTLAEVTSQPVTSAEETTQPEVVQIELAASDPVEEPVISEPSVEPEPAVPDPEPADAEPAIQQVAAITSENTGQTITREAVEDIAAEKQALIDHVRSWAAAWSDRDVERYLTHYSPVFIPRDNLTLDEWKEQRHGRLRWREFIIVEPSQYNITVNGAEASVNFTQFYKSDRFQDTIRKTLKMQKAGRPLAHRPRTNLIFPFR